MKLFTVTVVIQAQDEEWAKAKLQRLIDQAQRRNEVFADDIQCLEEVTEITN